MNYFGMTDIGKKRRTNQDNFMTVQLCDDAELFVLCDGMGGTNGGNIASSLAIKTFAEYIENIVVEHVDEISNKIRADELNFSSLLCDAVSWANKAVFNAARECSELMNMGTTLVGCITVAGKLYTVNVGDSRLYKIEEGTLTQLTHDHSYVQMLVDMGQITKEEALTNPRRNILTRAVGTESSVESDVECYEMPKSGSYLILCSDGLYNFVNEDEIYKLVDSPSDNTDTNEELTDKVRTLVDTANANGGGDNITIILAKID